MRSKFDEQLELLNSEMIKITRNDGRMIPAVAAREPKKPACR